MLHVILAATSDHTDVYVATLGQVLIAVITTAGLTAGTVMAAGIPGRRRSRKKQDEIHEQVVNTHSTNFRVDVDKVDAKVDRLGDRMEDVMSVMGKVVARLDRTSGDVGKVKADVERVDTRTDTMDSKIDALDTRLTDHIDGR